MPFSALSPHVLIIDDDRDFLSVVVDCLLGEGIRVTASPSLLAAAEVIALAPDRILVDLSFSGRDAGWSFLRDVRQAPELRATPVVLITGATLTPTHLHTLHELDVAVLLKPFDLDDLIAAARPERRPRRSESRLLHDGIAAAVYREIELGSWRITLRATPDGAVYHPWVERIASRNGDGQAFSAWLDAAYDPTVRYRDPDLCLDELERRLRTALSVRHTEPNARYD